MNKREQYDAIQAQNYSRLKWLLRSPRAFAMDEGEEYEERQCLTLGRLVHSVRKTEHEKNLDSPAHSKPHATLGA